MSNQERQSPSTSGYNASRSLSNMYGEAFRVIYKAGKTPSFEEICEYGLKKYNVDLKANKELISSPLMSFPEIQYPLPPFKSLIKDKRDNPMERLKKFLLDQENVSKRQRLMVSDDGIEMLWQ